MANIQEAKKELTDKIMSLIVEFEKQNQLFYVENLQLFRLKRDFFGGEKTNEVTSHLSVSVKVKD